jgi:two-component system sensor kinase FixL
VLITALSAVVAMHFLLPPSGMSVAHAADQLSLGVFVTGLVISWLNHRLQTAQQMQRNEAAAASARAERLDAILNLTVDGIIVIDAHGRIEAFNRAAERLFGYTIDGMLGRNVDMLTPSPYHEDHDTYLSRHLKTGRAKIIGIGREVQGRRKDGTTFPLHLSVGEITVQGERKFTGILHDLTGRVQMEGRLREQAALAKLGEMAAVIAHEIKNPLAGIRGAIQVFGGRMVKEGATTQILNQIVARIDSLDQMMKDLLLFARPPKSKPAPVDLVPLVRTTANLLSADPAPREVEIHVEGAAPPVSADPDIMRVVFQNLLINSAHAMQAKAGFAWPWSPPTRRAKLRSWTPGPAFRPTSATRFSSPFFTTRKRGSGLGLPTVKCLIEAHNWQLHYRLPIGRRNDRRDPTSVGHGVNERRRTTMRRPP